MEHAMSIKQNALVSAIKGTFYVCCISSGDITKRGDIVAIKSAFAGVSAEFHDAAESFFATFGVLTAGILHLNDKEVYINGFTSGTSQLDLLHDEAKRFEMGILKIKLTHEGVLNRHADAVSSGAPLIIKQNDAKSIVLNKCLWEMKKKGQSVLFFPGPHAFEFEPIDPKLLRNACEKEERVIVLRACDYVGLRPCRKIMESLSSVDFLLPWVMTIEGSDEVSDFIVFMPLSQALCLQICQTKISARVKRVGNSIATCLDSFTATDSKGNLLFLISPETQSP